AWGGGGAGNRDLSKGDVLEQAASLARERRLAHPRRDTVEADGDAQAVACVVLEHRSMRVEDDRPGHDEPRLGRVERRETRKGGQRDERRRCQERESAGDLRACVGQVPPPFLARRQTCSSGRLPLVSTDASVSLLQLFA